MEKKETERLSKKLNTADIADMLTHLVWVPALYRTFCSSIKGAYFDPAKDERCFAYVWGALKDYYTKEGTQAPPERSKFEMYLRMYLRQADPMPGEEEMLFGDDPTSGLLANIFSPERESLTYTTGEPLVKQFLMERAVANSIVLRVNEMRKFTGYVDMNEAENLRKLADEATRIEFLSAEVAIEPLAPDTSYFSKAKKLELVPTGISWIDSRIGDGQRYGDVNGLIGPTGSGKTTLGSQLFVSNVKEASSQYQLVGEDRVCVFYTYEQKSFDLQQKIFSNAFSIARNSITEYGYLDNLSRGTADSPLKDYERGNRFGGQSEYERYNLERELYSRHGIIRNMSGVADVCDDARLRMIKQNKGMGGIQEIVNDLHYIRDIRKQQFRAVFIDYLGLVMERQYQNTNDPKMMYYALKRFGDEVRQKIAGEFNCVVWLLHQMAGSANKIKPTTPLTHADSEGCRSLANNMANCLCLGTKDPGYRGGGSCLYLTFSKTRHSGDTGFDNKHLILQHDTVFARLDNVTDSYRPDRGNSCFYPIGDDYYE